MKVLVIYNISGHRSHPASQPAQESAEGYYKGANNSVLSQDFDEFHVDVSSHMSTPGVRGDLSTTYKDRVSFNWVNCIVPLGVTFNHSVALATKSFGMPDCVLYLDSGVQLRLDNNDRFKNNEILRALYDIYKSGLYAMVAGNSSDNGYTHWELYKHTRTEKEIFVLPIGKAVNMHIQLFSSELIKAYGRILPDIFAADASESVFNYLCAAIKRKFAVAPHLKVAHNPLDGASSGFGRGNHLFRSKLTIDEIYKLGKQYGFGFNECYNNNRNPLQWPHDDSLYDADGFPIHAEELRDFLKNHLFLKDDVFEYNKMPYSWEPAR